MEINLNRVDYIQVILNPLPVIFYCILLVILLQNVYLYVPQVCVVVRLTHSVINCISSIFSIYFFQVGVTSQKTMRLLPAVGKKATQKVFLICWCSIMDLLKTFEFFLMYESAVKHLFGSGCCC